MPGREGGSERSTTAEQRKKRGHQCERGEKLAAHENHDEDRGIPIRFERHHPVSRSEIHAKHVKHETTAAQSGYPFGG